MAREIKDQFKPKWRHFPVNSTLYLLNPFKEDIEFQVADERNVPYVYQLKAGKVGELPGGPIATLGLKAVIDKMIGNSKEDHLSIWSLEVRAKYESQVIKKVKEAPKPDAAAGPQGVIDLSAKDYDDDKSAPAAQAAAEEEPAFPQAQTNQQQQPQPARQTQQQAPPLVPAGQHGLSNEDQVIEED
jgi:hypothetical protein